MAQKRSRNESRTGTKRLAGKVDVIAGGAICATAAALASLIARGYHWRTIVPLVFTAVLLLVAFIFGSRAGLAGTAVAGVIFAMLLFHPLGRLGVSDDGARTNLGWMLMIGIGFSLLFAPPSSGLRQR